MEHVLLSMQHISKSYPGVQALDDVSLRLDRGQILALAGENGAGKSTLMKILSGSVTPSGGTILLDGEEVSFSNPRQALDAGISIMYQELNYLNDLSIAENIFVGRLPQNGLLNKIDYSRLHKDCSALLERVGLHHDPFTRVRELSVAEKQLVEIAKAISRNIRILIMDEPTSALNEEETKNLFRIIRELAAQKIAIIYISHRMEEIFEISDRVMVMRDGKYVDDLPTAQTTREELIRLMVGRDVSLNIEKEEMEFGKNVFSVKDLVYVDQFGKTRLDHVSFTIKEGQILGIAGIDGNGQSELVEAIVGTLKQQQGTITMNGKDISNAPVLARQEAGISHVSEDRMKFGTAPKLSLEDNAISKVYYTDKLKTHGLLDSKKISEFTNRILKEFLVKYDNSKQSIAELSGGNVQKVVVGREFDYEPDLLIMNQPTRGIDVGAIEFIRKKIVDMRSRKKAILLVSADLSEILSLSDTILVMHEGRIVGHISDVKNTSENELGLYMLGVKEDSKEQIGGAYCE